MTDATPPIGSVARAFHVLELIAAERDGMAVTTIAARAGLDKGTVSRLTRTLHELGYLHRGRDRLWRISGRVLSLTRGFEAQFNLREVARPVLLQLRDEVNETINLAVRQGANLLYVDQIQPSHAVVVSSMLGRLSPLYATAMGRSVLFELPHTEQLTILRESRDQPVEHNEVRLTAQTLASAQKTAKDLGYVTVPRTDDLSRVAAVIHDALGEPIGAVGVYGPKFRMQDQLATFAYAARQAADEITRLIGGVPDPMPASLTRPARSAFG